MSKDAIDINIMPTPFMPECTLSIATDDLQGVRAALGNILSVRITQAFADGNGYQSQAYEPEPRREQKLASNPVDPPHGVKEIHEMFCGCGDNEAAWQEIINELERCKFNLERCKFNRENKPADMKEPGDSGLWYIMAYLLDSHQLTEHGTSVHYAWLTDEGEHALEFLKTHEKDDYGQWMKKETV